MLKCQGPPTVEQVIGGSVSLGSLLAFYGVPASGFPGGQYPQAWSALGLGLEVQAPHGGTLFVDDSGVSFMAPVDVSLNRDFTNWWNTYVAPGIVAEQQAVQQLLSTP